MLSDIDLINVINKITFYNWYILQIKKIWPARISLCLPESCFQHSQTPPLRTPSHPSYESSAQKVELPVGVDGTLLFCFANPTNWEGLNLNLLNLLIKNNNNNRFLPISYISSIPRALGQIKLSPKHAMAALRPHLRRWATACWTWGRWAPCLRSGARAASPARGSRWHTREAWCMTADRTEPWCHPQNVYATAGGHIEQHQCMGWVLAAQSGRAGQVVSVSLFLLFSPSMCKMKNERKIIMKYEMMIVVVVVVDGADLSFHLPLPVDCA